MTATAPRPTIDRETVAGPMRRALGRPAAEIVDWEYRPLLGGTAGAAGEASSALYRVAGTATDHGELHSWSVILKTLAPVAGADDPSDLYYWKREVLAYQSGLLADLPGGLVAPRCFGVVEHSGGGAWLWLEEIMDHCGPRWPFTCYAHGAHSLGRFNGAYLTDHVLPAAPWLSMNWVGTQVAQTGRAMAQLPGVLDHPLVRRAYAAEIASRVERLWAQRAVLLAALNRFPQTFCHLDAFRRNLFVRSDARGQHETVAIDWAFAGTGALGEDLVSFVLSPVIFFEIEPAHLPALEELALTHYTDGLHAAGWAADVGMVRLGYTSAAALRFGLGFLSVILGVVLDERQHPAVEQAIGHPMDEIMERVAVVVDRVLNHADEALALSAGS